MATNPPPARMYCRKAVFAASRCAPVVVSTAAVGETAVPCFHIVSRLVLPNTTALYGLPIPGIRLTSSVQSTWTPTSPIHLIIVFCRMFAADSGGFNPGASAGPRCACLGPAVRVYNRIRSWRLATHGWYDAGALPRTTL